MGGELSLYQISNFRNVVEKANYVRDQLNSVLFLMLANKHGISSMNPNYNRIYADGHLPVNVAEENLKHYIEKLMHTNGDYDRFIDYKHGKFKEPRKGTQYDYISRKVNPELDKIAGEYERSCQILDQNYVQADKIVEQLLSNESIELYLGKEVTKQLRNYKKAREELTDGYCFKQKDSKNKGADDYLSDAINAGLNTLKQKYIKIRDDVGSSHAEYVLKNNYIKCYPNNPILGEDKFIKDTWTGSIFDGIIKLADTELASVKKARLEKEKAQAQQSQKDAPKEKEKPVKEEKTKTKKTHKSFHFKKTFKRTSRNVGSFFGKIGKGIGKLFVYLGKGIFYLFKYLFIGIFLLFKYIGIGIYLLFEKAWRVILIILAIGGFVGGVAILIVKGSKPTLYNVDNGVLVNEPTCNSTGLFRITETEKKPFKKSYTNFDIVIPETHTFDKTNKCSKCGKELQYNLDRILYKKLNDGNGDYICIYSLLPSQEESCVIPPYIDGVPVKEVHLNLYDPNIGSKFEKIEEVPSYINETLANVYGKDKKNDVYIYSSGADECVYYGNSEYTSARNHRYDYCIDKKNIYAIGDFKDIVIEQYGFARSVIMTGNVEHYVEQYPLRYWSDDDSFTPHRSTGKGYGIGEDDGQLTGPIFLKQLKEYRIVNLNEDGSDNYVDNFVVPYGLEILSIPDGFRLFDIYLNYQSEYFNFIDGNLYSKDKEYAPQSDRVKDKEFKGELKSKESNYIENQNINRYFDCYREEGGFRPDLVKTIHIKTKDDFINKFVKAQDDTFFRDHLVVLDNDIDFNGETIGGVEAFGGIFDGQGHTISNANNGVLFYSNNGVIKNLKLDHCNEVSLTYFNNKVITDIEITNCTLTGKDGYSSFVCDVSKGTSITEIENNVISNIRVANCTLTYDYKMEVYYDKVIYIGAVVAYSDSSSVTYNNIISENNTIKVNVIADLINYEKTKTNKQINVGGVFGSVKGNLDDYLHNVLSKNNDIDVNVRWQAANITFEKTVDLVVGGIAGEIKNGSGTSYGLLYDSMSINNAIKTTLTGSSSEYSVTTRKLVSEIANFTYFDPLRLDVMDINLFTDNVNEGNYIIGAINGMSGRAVEEVEKYNIKVVDLNTFELPERMFNNGWSIQNGIINLEYK